MQFNKNQQLAVEHKKGAMLVLAGPGSGKTAVITGRVKRLIEEGVAPEKILVITFSRAAAVEMKTRFGAICEESYNSVSFGTFHAVFFKILRCDGQYQYSNIISEEDRYRVIRDFVVKAAIPADNMTEFVEHLSATVSAVKSAGVPVEKYETDVCRQEDFIAVFNAYREYLQIEGKIDFDDMMTLCLELFEARPDVLHKWQAAYEYILIDEFQDINPLQYRLVRLLAEPENNVFAVGDDDQSVYGFRGAHPRLMLRFEKDFAGCRRIVLNVNYRSRTEILERADKLIESNGERFEKKSVSSKGPGGHAEYIRFDTVEEEYEYIAEYVRARIAGGRNPGNIAVLYRMNYQARGLYRALTVKNIPCDVREHVQCVFDHWVSEDIRVYMKLAAGHCTRGELLRVINRPKRYVTRDAVAACMDEKREYGGEILDRLIDMCNDKAYVAENLKKLKMQLNMLARLDAFGSVKFVRKAMGYDAFLKEYSAEHNVPEAELLELASELEASAHGYGTLEDWMSAMEEIRRKLKEAEISRREGRNRSSDSKERTDGVALMTFHSAKGLEFDTVFIIDAMEGLAPSKRAKTASDFEEERRVFYVAMTRAKEELYICGSADRFGREFKESRFVKEAGCHVPEGK